MASFCDVLVYSPLWLNSVLLLLDSIETWGYPTITLALLDIALRGITFGINFSRQRAPHQVSSLTPRSAFSLLRQTEQVSVSVQPTIAILEQITRIYNIGIAIDTDTVLSSSPDYTICNSEANASGIDIGILIKKFLYLQLRRVPRQWLKGAPSAL